MVVCRKVAQASHNFAVGTKTSGVFMTTEEQKIIEYWTNKINVEQKLEHERLRREQEEQRREYNRTHKCQIMYEPGLIITPDMERAAEIPVADYEVLQKNNVQLTGLWSCESGIVEYEKVRKMTWFEESNFAVSSGTPIVGYYRLVGMDDNGNLICYYNRRNANAFVSEEVTIRKYQLFAPNSVSNKVYLEVGDVFRVENIELINNRYAIKWQVL